MVTAKSEVQLLGKWPCPYVNRVQMALNLKGINYEFLEEKMGSKSELLLKSNPVYKKIPVLLHNDKPICESLIIVQYIDEVWTEGPSILPADPYDRAISYFWAAYIDDKWSESLKEIRMGEGKEAKAAPTQQVIDGLIMLEEAFVKRSQGKAFFGGDGIGFLDLALGGFLGWLRVTEKMTNMKLLDETRTPSLALWAQRICVEDAAKNVIPDTEKLLEIAKLAQAMTKTAPPK